MQAAVAERAAKDGVGVSEVVNRLLEREIATRTEEDRQTRQALTRQHSRESELVNRAEAVCRLLEAGALAIYLAANR